MVRSPKPIKIRIGINIVTSFLTVILACVEGFVLIISAIFDALRGGEDWLFSLRFLAVLVGIWLVCFVVALIACRKRLIVTDSTLKVIKGKDVLYETPLNEIAWVGYDFFDIIDRSQIGEMLISAKSPVPEDLSLNMGWLSYKRVEKRIRSVQGGEP